MPTHIETFQPGASRRLEALTDGVFAIVATLLVLEIRVPELHNGHNTREMLDSLSKVMPSFIAFVFSFLNVMIFWVNTDAIGKAVQRFDHTTTYLNIFFLLFISMIPFTTHFVSEYPFSLLAVSVYGVVLFLCSCTGVAIFHHLAFRKKLLHDSVTLASRKRIWKRVVPGPLFFLLAILAGWIHVYIPIVFYILIPLAFIILPPMDFSDENMKPKQAKYQK